MRIRTLAATAVLLPAALAFSVAPASEDGSISIYAHCDGTLDEAGAAKLHDPTARVELEPGAPDVSFTAGGGCGTVDEPVFSAAGTGGSPYQFSAGGFAEAGDVDAITFELHFLGPNAGYAGQPLYLDVEAELDGVSLFGTKTSPDATGASPTTSAAAKRIEVVPEVSDSGASVKVEFTVTGIAELFGDRGDEASDFRGIQFSFGVPHTGACGTLPTNDTPRCVPSGFTGWVMGATEVPSGVTFAPAAPAAVTVEAVLGEA